MNDNFIDAFAVEELGCDLPRGFTERCLNERTSMKPTGRTILIVDDNPDDRFFIGRVLDRLGLGISAQFVVGGEDAVAYLNGDDPYADRLQFPYPSFIITDLEMNHGDGFSVLYHLQANPPASPCPVMMLSSSEDSAHVRKAYLLGATFYCVKPSNSEGLRSILTRFVTYATNTIALPNNFDMPCETCRISRSVRENFLATRSRHRSGKGMLRS